MFVCFRKRFLQNCIKEITRLWELSRKIDMWTNIYVMEKSKKNNKLAFKRPKFRHNCRGIISYN